MALSCGTSGHCNNARRIYFRGLPPQLMSPTVSKASAMSRLGRSKTQRVLTLLWCRAEISGGCLVAFGTDFPI